MKDKIDWAREFRDFVTVEESKPSPEISDPVLATVNESLNPLPAGVFARVAVIHIVVGAVSLLFCPQFGLSFSTNLGLMGLLMKFGTTVCTFGCGVFFLGSSALVASLVLRPEEIRVFRRGGLVHFPLLAAVSLGVFLISGAEVMEAVSFIWAAGSVVGALLSFEAGRVIRVARR